MRESYGAVSRHYRLPHSKSSNPHRLLHRVKTALRTRNIDMVVKTTTAAGGGTETQSAAIRAAPKLQAHGPTQAQDRVAEREASASRSEAVSARTDSPRTVSEPGPASNLRTRDPSSN